MAYIENPEYSIVLFMLSALLIGVAGVGPNSIKTFGISWEDGKFHFGFSRYKPTKQERELALKLAQDKPSPETEKEGQSFIKKAEERTSEQRSPEDYLALATEKWRANDYDAALEYVFAGLALNPENIRIKASLIHRKGSIYHNLGLLDKGIKYYKEAIELDLDFALPHISMGNVCRGQGKLKEAVAEYIKAIELDPKFAFFHDNLGTLYCQQGKLEEAEVEYKEAIALDPKDANPYNNLGALYYDQGKREEAEVEFIKAIELDPRVASVHNNLGNVYYVQGKLEVAKREYEEALRLNPNFNAAKKNLEKFNRIMKEGK